MMWNDFLAEAYDIDTEFDGLMQKAQYDTSAAGNVNDVFGATLYEQYNAEHNFYAALPQVNRTSMGGTAGDSFGVMPKAFRAAHSPVSLQTHSEGGSVPAGTTFTVDEVSFEVKRSETVLEVSDLQQIESMIEDAVGFDDFVEAQRNQLDLAVDRDGIGDAVTSGNSGYAARDKITELDRAISATNEETNGVDETATAYTDGDLDYGSIDRTSDDWADSYVINDGTSDQLNESNLNDFLNSLNEFGTGNPFTEGVILTGHNSGRVISDLAADRAAPRSPNPSAQQEQVADAMSMLGFDAMGRAGTYDGIPIVTNQNAPSRSGSLEDVFVINTGTINGEPRIAVEQYAEPYMETAGRGQDQGYLATGEYSEQGLFLLNHELVVRDFASHGKYTDLTE